MIVVSGMLHIIVATHGILLVGVEFGLQNVAEHLYVVAAGAVAFRHKGIDVA